MGNVTLNIQKTKADSIKGTAKFLKELFQNNTLSIHTNSNNITSACLVLSEDYQRKYFRDLKDNKIFILDNEDSEFAQESLISQNGFFITYLEGSEENRRQFIFNYNKVNVTGACKEFWKKIISEIEDLCIAHIEELEENDKVEIVNFVFSPLINFNNEVKSQRVNPNDTLKN
ncbi:MAG: hypothetical protein RL728_1143 [Bacteroidota bacterium]|jgi:hypothetical protein